jgi:hypothetical protein
MQNTDSAGLVRLSDGLRGAKSPPRENRSASAFVLPISSVASHATGERGLIAGAIKRGRRRRSENQGSSRDPLQCGQACVP